MSKTEIERTVFQCDHVDEDGNRCINEGDEQAIHVCGVCHKDLCITHYELTTVTVQGTRDHFTYYFCPHHNDEFMETLVDKYGDSRPVAQTGYGISIV